MILCLGLGRRVRRGPHAHRDGVFEIFVFHGRRAHNLLITGNNSTFPNAIPAPATTVQAAKVHISGENARSTVPTKTASMAINKDFSKPIFSATLWASRPRMEKQINGKIRSR